jgi:DNA-binding transcriptional MerR regulator
MVTIAEVAARTGLSPKTLSRWAKKGVIPKPCIKTHPSGHGKVGYFPDGVLEKCIRLAQLRREGIELDTARMLVLAEGLAKQFEQVDLPLARKLVAQKEIALSDGQTVNMQQLLLSAVIREVQESLLAKDSHEMLITKLRTEGHIRQCLHLIRAGCNPFLTFDGQDVRIKPDFLLGHAYDAGGIGPRPTFLLPLLPIYNRLLSSVGAEELIQEPEIGPAPRAWARNGDSIVEYDFYPGGPNGFRLIKGRTKSIGKSRTEERVHGPTKAK